MAKKEAEEMPRQGDQKGTVRRALWATWTACKILVCVNTSRVERPKLDIQGRKGLTHL